jgi:leader peptidase (prepilin peptidase)/N-methyltransferase
MDLATSILPVAVSPFIGSFLGTVATRFEAPATILWGRSMCPACGRTLGARDLVPLLSWAAARGRCRQCGAAIGLFYPAVELAALVIALWSVLATDGAAVWASCVLGWTLLALAWIDVRQFLLPDFLTLPLIAVGLAVTWWLGPQDLPDHVIGATAGLMFVIIVRQIYAMVRHQEGIGLGDAKLLAAAGAFVSWEGLPSVVAISAVAGLGAALAASALRRRDGGASISLTDRVPFGAFLCIGTWIVWLYGPLGG